jgi:uncharacterized protein (TIGR02145 family)
MKKVFLVFVLPIFIFGCSTQNPNPNSNNTTYIQGPNVNDIDGNIYTSVVNCGQTWMQRNLNVSHYRNGDIIPQVTDPTQWTNLTTGAWCYYNNDLSNGAIYGKLYNWYAVNDPRGLAPSGWHIPSFEEWVSFETCLGDYGVAGGKMKEIGLFHWNSPNTGATNSSGFTALPGGTRYSSNNSCFFFQLHECGIWWSSNEPPNSDGFYYPNVYFDSELLFKTVANKTSGYYVRCVKN